MKTTIVQVEMYDDAVSIRDKIAWSKSQRILLDLPRKKKIYLSLIDIEIIDRTARENGAKLGIVTRDGKTRDFARSLNIHTFRSLREAERAIWEDKRKFNPLTTASKKGFAILNEIKTALPDMSAERKVSKPIKLGLLATFILTFFFLIFIVLPSAVVTIYPLSKPQTIEVVIHASTSVERMNIAGLIPAEKRMVTLTGKKAAYSSGSVSIGETKARGDVSVRNLTQSTVNLPAGTIFSTTSTPAIRFTNVYNKEIPAGETPVTLSVVAVLPGVEGNIYAGEIAVVEGNIGALLEVTNAKSFSGGSLQVFPSPTEYDYITLRKNLLKDMETQVLTEAELNQNDGWVPIKESVKLEEVIQENQGNSPGEPSDTLNLNITAKYSILYYNPVDVDQLIAKVAEFSIPEGYHLAATGMKLNGSGNVILSSPGEAFWTVQVQNQIIQNYPVDKIKNMLRAKTKSETIRILNQEIPHYQSAEVSTSVWWPWLPVILNQIQIHEVAKSGG